MGPAGTTGTHRAPCNTSGTAASGPPGRANRRATAGPAPRRADPTEQPADGAGRGGAPRGTGQLRGVLRAGRPRAPPRRGPGRAREGAHAAGAGPGHGGERAHAAGPARAPGGPPLGARPSPQARLGRPAGRSPQASPGARPPQRGVPEPGAENEEAAAAQRRRHPRLPSRLPGPRSPPQPPPPPPPRAEGGNSLAAPPNPTPAASQWDARIRPGARPFRPGGRARD